MSLLITGTIIIKSLHFKLFLNNITISITLSNSKLIKLDNGKKLHNLFENLNI
jgi:hypothetical protein